MILMMMHLMKPSIYTDKHMPSDSDASKPTVSLRPYPPTTPLLQMGGCPLGVHFGKLSSRPQTTAPYLTRRINNSQRSSDTESSDDIKFQKQHRVASAISYGAHTKKSMN